jgi:hypothetical protein
MVTEKMPVAASKMAEDKRYIYSNDNGQDQDHCMLSKDNVKWCQS